MAESMRDRIEAANRRAYDVFVGGQPVWVGVRPAGEVVPGLRRNVILHTGPELDFDRMLPAHQSGIIGGILFEGLARTREEAIDLIHRGEVQLAPGVDYWVPGGGMASTSFSMPVAVAEDTVHGTRGFVALQEGPSYEALRWGVYNDVVADRWSWFREILGPSLDEALKAMGGINLRTIIARSLQAGDENHSRELCSSLLLLAELAPHLSVLGLSRGELSRCFEFLRTAERFALHILMAGATAVLRAAENIEYCTVVTAMGGNGVELGIKVSNLGNRWFTAPAPIIKGRYLNPSWVPEDTVPFAGDSCAVEVYGLGGLAAAASPAVTLLAGGTVEDALDRTREMWTITVGKNPNYAIPALNFEGTPTCVDMVKVLETSIEPQSHAGIIHKKGGQAGAGVARVPVECFKKAFLAFAEKYGLD